MIAAPLRSHRTAPTALRAPAWVAYGLLVAGVASFATAAAFAEAPPRTPPTPPPTPLLAPHDGPALDLPSSEHVPSPAQLLGRPLGERFTSGEQILDVLDALAAASERVTVVDYGSTTEGRPLRLAVLARPDRLADLDSLLAARRRGALDAPALLWLAAGVHGDEASSSEAALAVLHALAAATPDADPALAAALDELIVVIDPNVNPDGRARYVGWLRGAVGAAPDPDPRALEHQPPWPTGRTNHYLFDLNRDWAWATQNETRRRLEALARFEPEVYVDLHEMGAERTYFFPPAADPVHPAVPDDALDWLDVFGRANAAAFDERSWLYFVRDVYDLFYPAYGDTYPILRGGVGMTYEMAGGERAGLALELPSGSRLTLTDRVARHTVSALTTVRTAALHARTLRRDAMARRATPDGASWLWHADQPEARALAALLARHGTDVSRLATPQQLRVVPAITRASIEPVEREFPAGSWTVTARGASRPLVEALMGTADLEPAFLAQQHERLEAGLDAQIYDVTAWALPLAYGVETWHLPAQLPARLPAQRAEDADDGALPRPDTQPAHDTETHDTETHDTETHDTETHDTETHDTETYEPTATAHTNDGRSEPLGWILPPSGLDGYRFAAALLADGASLRWATERLDQAPAGSLFVPRAQERVDDIARRVTRAARAAHVAPRVVTTSWADEGSSLGGNALVTVRRPRIGLVGGDGVQATDHGALWHLLDRQLGIAPSRRLLRDLDAGALAELDVLVLPDGDGYSRHAHPETAAALRPWLERGGVVIAVGGAARWLIDRDLLTLEIRDAEPSLDIPGIALATERGDHPLGAGLATSPAALALDDLVFEPSDDPQVDILRVRADEPLLAGTAWPGTEDHVADSLLVARRSVGEGHIVAFAQPPAFRGMWRATMPLLLDAVLFLPWL